MRERNDSTTTAGAAPEANGVLVSIFVPDDYPVMQLKRALDWAEVKAVMIKHWRKAGKNVDGGRGLPWPADLYAPLLVLMWVRTYHSRQMEEYLIESVVARRFLDLQDEELKQIRDHSSIARAEEALGAEGRAEVNELIIKAAEQQGFSSQEILSSDTTVQEPRIGHPNEPGILKGWAERIERALKKLKAGGVKSAQAGIEKAKEIYRQVRQHHLFAKTKEEKKKILGEIVKQSEALSRIIKEVIEQVSERCGRVKLSAKAKLNSSLDKLRLTRRLDEQLQ